MAVTRSTGAVPPRRKLQSYLPGFILVATLWAALSAWITWDYRTELKVAGIQTDTLTRAVAEHTDRILREADQLTKTVSLATRQLGFNVPLRSYFDFGLVEDDVFLQIALIDADGILRASTEPNFEPVDLSDREHVWVHHVRNSDQLFVGKPVVGRASGRPSIQLSRGIRDDTDELLGVVVISVDPNYFTNFYRELAAAKDINLIVVGTHDYVVRARHRPYSALSPSILSATSPLRHALRNSTQGVFTWQDAPGPGGPRIASFRKLNDYPVAVALGVSRQQALAPFQARRNSLLLAGLAVTALIVYVEWRRGRLLDRLSRTAHQLDHALQSVASKAGRVEAFLKAAPDAVVSFSDRGEVEYCNPRMYKLLNISSAAEQPHDIAQFVTRLFACDTSPDRIAKQHRLCTELVDALRTEPSTRNLHIELYGPKPRTYEFRLASLPSPGASLMLIVRDMTSLGVRERKQTLAEPASNTVG